MLTTWQQHSAKFDGGKKIANRKATMARVASSLEKLIKDANAEGLASLLSAQDVKALRQAQGIVHKVARAMEQDVAQAQGIKAAWEARHKDAVKALMGIIQEPVADVIALADLAGNLYPDRLARECVKWGWESQVLDLRRDAVGTLAHRAANASAEVAGWVQALAAELPAARAKHAVLIAQVNALAVAHYMQRAAA